jgi:hypothetical protein
LRGTVNATGTLGKGTETSIEAVAIEVERISEGQRFTTKLLSEGRSAKEKSLS